MKNSRNVIFFYLLLFLWPSRNLTSVLVCRVFLHILSGSCECMCVFVSVLVWVSVPGCERVSYQVFDLFRIKGRGFSPLFFILMIFPYFHFYLS